VAKYSFLTLQQVGHAIMTELYMIKAHNTGEAVSISSPSGHALCVRYICRPNVISRVFMNST